MNTMELQQAIGAQLKEARLMRGITQAELGEHLGVSRNKVANYETGRSAIPAVLLVQAAAACHTSLADFDPVTNSGAIARIIRTLRQRPDALEFVEELLQSFAPLVPSHTPAPFAPAPSDQTSVMPERALVTHAEQPPAQRNASGFRPARRRGTRVIHRRNSVR